jgi:hypothetical protein
VANYIARVGNRRLRNRTNVMFAPLCQQLPTRFGIWPLDSRGVIRKGKAPMPVGASGLRSTTQIMSWE